jgi:hypothetical protein
MWDGPASAKDVAKIVAEYSRQWGGCRTTNMCFNMIVEAAGLEHKNSTWLGASLGRTAARRRLRKTCRCWRWWRAGVLPARAGWVS